MPTAPSNRMPIAYVLIRWLFKFVLKLFYGTIVIENAEYLPVEGESCILCANHGNALTDSLLLVAASKNHLRLSAKSTLFGKRTFSSWLIEKSGALPIKRRMDHRTEEDVDNSEIMEKLYEALDHGNTICLFPEGMSRYRSTLMPLKTGVARIISEVLTRNKADPNFEITLLTCSITYMHRQHFRSDVLMRFNAPTKFKPRDHPELIAPVDFGAIKSLTEFMADEIRAGTLVAPSWEVIHTAKIATRMYAPLGTRMALGDYVRVIQMFIDGFTKTGRRWNKGPELGSVLEETEETEAKLQNKSTEESHSNNGEMKEEKDDQVDILAQDLNAYHARLMQLGVSDERIRTGPLSRRETLIRITARAAWLTILSFASFPGLVLWAPVFATTKVFSLIYSRSGDPEDVWDEIAQNKLLAGLFSGLFVWFTCVLFTLPLAPITFFLVPCWMWISLRWLEDAVSAFRALVSLICLFCIKRSTLVYLVSRREQLRSRVVDFALKSLNLPEDPSKYFQERGGRQKGRVMGPWDSGAAYFSLRRRRKKDWDEILRI